jgi:hypothetical protein
MNSNKSIFGLMSAMIVLALGLAAPALAADNDWQLQSVECDAVSLTITVTGIVDPNGGFSTSTDSIYLNDIFVISHAVDTKAFGAGTHAYSIKRSEIVAGMKVKVTNEDGGPIVNATCGDAPIAVNEGHGDHYAALFKAVDSAGLPLVKVYCIINARGVLMGSITRADFANYSKTPARNTLIKTIKGCAAPVAVYLLTTGEYQVNIGPDVEGKIAVIVFSQLPPVNVYFYDLGA